MKHLTNQLNNLKESFNLLRKSPFYIAVPVLIDIIFLLIVGFVGSLLTSKAIPHLQGIAILNQGPSPITSITNNDPSAILSQQVQIMALLTKVLLIFAQVIIAILLLWIIFQGINWFLASKCAKNKTNPKKYFLNFSIVTILGFILALIVGILFLNVTIRNMLTLNYLISPATINAITILILFVILYFLFIGYALSHKYNLRDLLKNIFVKGIKDFKKIILLYITLLILFLIANYIIDLFSSLGFGAMLISGIIVMLPLIAFSRVYLIKNLEK